MPPEMFNVTAKLDSDEPSPADVKSMEFTVR